MTNFKFLKKRKTLIILGSLGFIILFVLAASLMDEEPARKRNREPAQEQTAKLDIKSAQAYIPENEVWRYKTTQNFEDHSKKQDESQQQIIERLDQFQKQIDAMEKEKEAIHFNPITEDLFGERASNFNTKEVDLAPFIPAQIHRHKLNLSKKEEQEIEKKIFKTTDTIIHATTFVKATLLSGVDASTAIVSSDDPIPVMIKLRNDGYIPRKLKSDLKGCHVLAAAKGNLSSERVYIRLEKLVCTEIETKEIIETDVSGYVVGPDGKNGIRGEVISKEGKYLGRAAVGGVLSGFAAVLNPDNALRNPGNAILQSGRTQGKGDLFKSGLGGSVSNSTDRLAQYYIDRAEQIQPVISVPGGVDVEIVFTSSVDIGSSNVKQKISLERDKKREIQIENLWHGE